MYILNNGIRKHCRAICCVNPELLRPVYGTQAQTQANCPPTHVLERFVTWYKELWRHFLLILPIQLTREVAALRVGLATSQNRARTCHAYWKRFLVPYNHEFVIVTFLSNILMQLMWNPMCPLRVPDAECMPCLRCQFLAASPGPTLLTWQVHETYRCVTYQLKVLAPLFTKQHGFLEGSQASPVCPTGKSNM